ncbi:single-stranded DNA-binding protein [Pseudarthrobacter sp. J64]|uniref:single-stranded DNA-binding protein n=1 Tax=Pseudarthrobacter sp. J64 TaxID=3116485 RepID=UPI002E81F98A|nr:single-stranded DNA-binding protein [Pseudarthrobacter sp. J64]MEE2568620.1 single-stranded DNA-binding protein [Pseudarthrobacter sp. J64]
MTDIITLRGFVGSEPKPSITKTGVQAVSFRFASPLQRWDSSKNAMGEDHLNWFTVQAYRQLAGNLACSIKKGQKIIVVCKIKNRTWVRDGQTHLEAELEAVTVGHDLKHGSASYVRTSDSNADYEGGNRQRNNQGPDGSDPGNYDAPEDADRPDEDPYASSGFDGEADGPLMMKDADGNNLAVDPSTGEVSAPV